MLESGWKTTCTPDPSSTVRETKHKEQPNQDNISKTVQKGSDGLLLDISDSVDFDELMQATYSSNPAVRKKALKEFCPCHVKNEE